MSAARTAKGGVPDAAMPPGPEAAEALHCNRLWHDPPVTPALSIVSPVFRNDPSALLSALARECTARPDLPVELVVVDDGSGDPALIERLMSAVMAFPAPAKLIGFAANQGRARARNRLIAGARAPYLLFLDSDMLPDQPDFLSAWTALITRVSPAIAYGGFSTLQASRAPELALARALAERIDCLPARDRTERGGLAVATSNLLVRADITQAVPFDDGFSGWGWEDVDWALRAVGAGFAVAHVDIPATHLGLDEPQTLLAKFRQAGPNFRHIVKRHPLMLSLPSTRAARILARVPLLGALTGAVRTLALSPRLPLMVRTRAARVWRAAHAAMSLKGG
jgi:glycosyltransferase involved in cell wall biosynthesis